MKNTFLDYELNDGSKIQLTLNFSRLLQLKNKKKDMYERYNKMLLKGTQDAIEDNIFVLYIAYLCANIEHLDDGSLMDLGTFINSIQQDFVLMNDTVNMLINPKKKTVSEGHS